jgi:hypothetical protein
MSSPIVRGSPSRYSLPIAYSCRCHPL